MAKRQTVMYEEMVFDNYQDAVNVKESAEEKLEKIGGAMGMISIIGTIAGVVGIFKFGGILLPVAFILACVCYVSLKCFGGALKWAVNFSKFGWYVCPFFPIDLVILVVFFFVGFFAFFFLPYFVVRGVKKQNLKELECAEEYIKNCDAQKEEN